MYTPGFGARSGIEKVRAVKFPFVNLDTSPEGKEKERIRSSFLDTIISELTLNTPTERISTRIDVYAGQVSQPLPPTRVRF